MPQKTNFNISPYFDDYNPNKSYHKVLFKPGYPIQARELTTLQSILQNQIEQFGTHLFKEGSVVIPGSFGYRNDLNAVIIENENFNINVETYLPYAVGKTIKGQQSGVKARIDSYLSSNFSEIGNTTLYVTYLDSDSQDNARKVFLDSENLIIDEDLTSYEFDSLDPSFSLRSGEVIAKTVDIGSTAIGSAVYMTEGVYFVRGHFVKVYNDFLIISQYSNVPSVKVGFKIVESLVNSFEDKSLNDNSQGFSNYAAPGADRFRISLSLVALPIDSTDLSDFILLKEIRDGVEITPKNTTNYNLLSKEFARRTFDESGDYYVKKPTLRISETLNDYKGNNGIFKENSLTYNNNVPSEDLGTYIISPLKAYIRGYEVENIVQTYIDFKKPRKTKLLKNQSINYVTGPTFTLNRVYGSPVVGISTVSLRSSRKGNSQIDPAGKEIGLARVYDFALESGSYNSLTPDSNEWDITLYDIQTFTEISVNEPVDLVVPTQIKGKSSGAVGYLRYDSTNSGIITAYSIQGSFSVGERLIFDGIENTRVSTAITAYSTNDIKSIYGIVGTAYTFTADLKQYPTYDIGLVNISAESSGISTVTSTDSIFTDIADVEDVVSFSTPGLTIPTFAKIIQVSQNSLVISGVTTVSGICDGDLPSSDINPSNFKILNSKLQSSSDNTLYTVLPKQNIADVNLTNSNIIIRRQFDITITSNSTNTITALENETFLPFDEERYVLISESGVTEQLSQDKFIFTSGSRSLRINGLSSSGSAKLIATLRKTSVKAKKKYKNRVKSLIVDKSKYQYSGVGATTINDGLEYGNYPYGTRVQDEEICLLRPDVTRILGVFESNDTGNPDIPNLQLSSLSGDTGKTDDLILGEEIFGSSSEAVATYCEKVNDLQIGFIYSNSSRFIAGEEITFKESGIKAIVTSVTSGDNNITSNYSFVNGQKNTIYDYSKLVRNTNSKEPISKLKVIFECAEFLTSDDGDITTANSYEQFNYCDIQTVNGIRNSDIIDLRPRVSTVSVSENLRSPFEFLGRSFSNQYNNSSSVVLASDESSLMDYSFYLGRIDKIYLSKDGTFQLIPGTPSEIPQPPQPSQDSLEIATIYLPPYLCNIENITVNLSDHKRYRMIDIQNIENRVKNLEYYTSLSLLEVDTSNLLITDSNGLNRFKSGFFVDDFSTTNSQKKITVVKNSINIKDSELRPTHYTTQLDLLLGTNSLVGIGTSADPLADAKYTNDLIGSGIKRTGRVITLDYTEVPEINQPLSTRVSNVNPYSSDFFGGTIELFPSSDVWTDQVRLEPKTLNGQGNYTQTRDQLVAQGFDPQTGFGPVIWNSWETVWTGESVSNTTREVTRGYNVYSEEVEVTTKTGTSTRQGSRQVLKDQFDNTSFGDQVLNSELIPYVRSRNIEFTAKRLKPSTRMYVFFDGVDLNSFVVPKLLEINMTSGVFQVGETVVGSFDVGPGGFFPKITFRVAKQNHKYGSYNDPTDVYTLNPYNSNENIPEFYSSTSSILNVDTYSLANQPQGQFNGYISIGMKLRGQTSGAEATITSVKLITDNVGTLIGSLYIPDPNPIVQSNPKFEAGTKVVRLTNSSTNSQVIGVSFSTAEEKYHVEGKVNTVQENIIVIHNARIESETPVETRAETEVGQENVVKSTLIRTIPRSRPRGGGGSSSSGGGQRTYQGFAGGVNQNAGGSQSKIYNDGSRGTIGLGGVERALADGYSLASIANWARSTGSAIGEQARAKYGL